MSQNIGDANVCVGDANVCDVIFVDATQDLGALVPYHDIVVGYTFKVVNGIVHVVYDMRSKVTDVAVIAEALGGGGNKFAATFTVKFNPADVWVSSVSAILLPGMPPGMKIGICTTGGKNET